ncbi:S-adenosyl-L-methionine-dependent methyltransferase [Penicillium frequentans]|uniref:S-adenosyl-L-methionine-dependent methyltransferase n=1 Tax=Penicillium frequentans TaxID=3151616 RepID=A0AAD6D0N8_9EURO|nr:S-adenosyl-L-methionine-dependent methyltransferase [Penicillium glabrum]
MSTLSDSTFTNYTNDQAQKYAQLRGTYTDPLFRTIIDRHLKTGGKFRVLADVGCGPGNATKPLARSFDYVVGLDPGVEMINTAQELGAKRRLDSQSSMLSPALNQLRALFVKTCHLSKITKEWI